MTGERTSLEAYDGFTIGTFVKFLGKPAASLLATSPFDVWSVEREVEEDLPERRVDYVFSEQGLSITCDQEDDERIRTIFLHPRELQHFDVKLIDFPLCFCRRDVLERMGTPSNNGAPRTHEILGAYGAWDRYDRPDCTLHVQYRVDADRIELITLMRRDVAP